MIYVSDTPWIPRGETGEVFNLWADTSDEAVGALYAVGGDPETQRRAECNSWEAYRVTPEQFADLMGLGVTVTDRLGPAYWCARRDGNHKLIERIDAARAGGCA